MMKFIHFLTGKIRMWGIKGIVITLEKETSEQMLTHISQFVDKVLWVKN